MGWRSMYFIYSDGNFIQLNSKIIYEFGWIFFCDISWKLILNMRVGSPGGYFIVREIIKIDIIVSNHRCSFNYHQMSLFIKVHLIWFKVGAGVH